MELSEQHAPVIYWDSSDIPYSSLPNASSEGVWTPRVRNSTFPQALPLDPRGLGCLLPSFLTKHLIRNSPETSVRNPWNPSLLIGFEYRDSF